tara:strand:- start:901 stop:1935 length:1035 start_codon:yes stop_codon:yes gene_type:complete
MILTISCASSIGSIMGLSLACSHYKVNPNVIIIFPHFLDNTQIKNLKIFLKNEFHLPFVLVLKNKIINKLVKLILGFVISSFLVRFLHILSPRPYWFSKKENHLQGKWLFYGDGFGSLCLRDKPDWLKPKLKIVPAKKNYIKYCFVINPYLNKINFKTKNLSKESAKKIVYKINKEIYDKELEYWEELLNIYKKIHIVCLTTFVKTNRCSLLQEKEIIEKLILDIFNSFKENREVIFFKPHPSGLNKEYIEVVLSHYFVNYPHRFLPIEICNQFKSLPIEGLCQFSKENIIIYAGSAGPISAAKHIYDIKLSLYPKNKHLKNYFDKEYTIEMINQRKALKVVQR